MFKIDYYFGVKRLLEDKNSPFSINMEALKRCYAK